MLGVAVSATLLSTSWAPASALTVGTGSPRWFIGKVEADRGNGAEIPLPMMQRISDLFNQDGLYGCTLNADNATCNTGADVSTTDTLDNYDHAEQQQGESLAQTSGALAQLCGTSPSPLPIDYVRAIQATLSSTACSTLAAGGYAKDGVVAETFATVNPSTYGSAIGPVAAGWRPGDPVSGPYSGRPFTNLVNNDNGGGVNSTAYRIYCATDATRITDWGQLTDPNQPVGQGAPIGAPISIFAVTPTAGTFKTLQTFAQSGVATACNANVNATTDTSANPLLASDAAQISDVVAATHPGDAAGQAVELSEGLYFESNGTYNTNPYRSSVQITSAGATTTFSAVKTQMNGISASAATELTGALPTTVIISNFYRTDKIRASTASFLNWICDNNSADKGKDLLSGQNYNDELTTTISTTFGFPRISCPLITSVADPNS